MRAGACTVQQTLTSEAASVLRHSLCLAKRRGHSQVTPLHVAATLLSSRASLLRRACLKSHPHSTSHPLQCRALELCFNVALNRLPTTPGPLLHGQPSLSNALIAALKRAQAHQRRGCIEQQQQQPLLAIKVELEQLIISILDDPSVSRVMREAGFSSTSVKNNLEDSSASSVWVLPSSCSPSPTETHRDIINHSSFWQTHFLNCSSEQNPVLFSTPKKHLATEKEEDFKLVLEVLLRKKRRNTVVIGDCVSITEGLVAELMGRVERGEVPDELRSTHFIKFQFSSMSLTFMKREDVEMKVADLRRKVASLVSGGGAIIYVGDLKWVVETSLGERDGGFSVGELSCYSPVDHLVAEVGRLISDYSCSNSKVWLMATANYQTYMRCQLKQPSLEIQWALQAVSVPSGGLGLSLHASSGLDSRMSLSQNLPQMLETKPLGIKEEQDKLSCCVECTSNFEKDAMFLKSGQQKPSSLLLSSGNINDMDKGSTQLPYWLQPHRADSHHKDDLAELRKKWNRLCHSLHHPKPNQIHSTSSLFNNQSSSVKSYTSAPSYSWWPNGSQHNTFPDSNSISFVETTSKPNHNSNFVLQFGSQKPRCIEFGFGNGTHKNHLPELSLDSLKNTENKEVKITLALGNTLFGDSLKSLDKKRERELNPRDLCKLLQENVPWQSEIIPSMAEALLKSKSINKNGTWLLIEGSDRIGKRRFACAIAELVCGSANNVVHMNMRRENEATLCSKILISALRNHENSVVLIEEIDYADAHFIKILSDGFKSGNLEDPFGREVSFSEAIFIVTTGASTNYQDRAEKPDTMIEMKLQVEEKTPKLGLSKGNCKRKAEWELSNKAKNPRTCHKDDASSIVIENGNNNKKEFSRQSSSNTLDLNIRAEEEEEDDDDADEEKPEEFNTVPSDLTQETTTNPKIPRGFLESIENRFVFNLNSDLFSKMTKNFLSKLEGSFEEVCGSERRDCFSVDQMVIEKLVYGSGSFLASLFEKWLKDIFQTSLQTVKNGGKEVTVKLSLGGKEEESVLEVGFMGSNLPKTIQVAFEE